MSKKNIYLNFLFVFLIMVPIGFIFLVQLYKLKLDSPLLSSDYGSAIINAIAISFGSTLGAFSDMRFIDLVFDCESDEMTKINAYIKAKGKLDTTNEEGTVYHVKYSGSMLPIPILVRRAEKCHIKLSKNLWRYIKRKY